MSATTMHPLISRCQLTLTTAALTLLFALTPPPAIAEELPAGARPVAGWTVPGTQALSEGNRLFITFSQPPAADMVLRLPRLVSVVRTTRWLEGSTAEMSVQPEPREWLIRLTGLPGNIARSLPSSIAGMVPLATNFCHRANISRVSS